ncbi:hypothetical protein JRQ81_005652 [Phrynocephalus forsythii]|uniref:Sulfotransferase n=1 Tax=Phrynocephalus forsythii TaxID=171643 RepID=A0A9Q0XHA7_9SAUR|nr:hypothetical protein JRQ81_005652 [Phrynocephalus forsythii]
MKCLELMEVKVILLHKSTAERWSLISEFKAQPDDLLICSYPKSGTTWVQEIVEMIHFEGDTQECGRAPMYKWMPFLEMPHTLVSSVEEADMIPSPRRLKTHLSVQLVPASFWERKCKIIYIARNVKDSCLISISTT